MPDSAAERLARLISIANPETARHKLATMLRHNSTSFRGLSTSDCEWLRGQLYAVAASQGVSPGLEPAMLEELRTSLSPIVLAGVARAFAGSDRVQSETRKLLHDAADRIRARDEYCRFEVDGATAKPRTAVEELFRAAALEPTAAAACCRGPVAFEWRSWETIAGAELQDQDGRKAKLREVVGETRALCAPFYVRCMNSQKCSATIARLAEVARRSSLTVFGLSYDPLHDDPDRLRAYAEAREFPFSERAALMRCTKGWPAIRKCLDLQAGYGDTTVNDHARELFLFHRTAGVSRLDPELLSTPEELLAQIASS